MSLGTRSRRITFVLPALGIGGTEKQLALLFANKPAFMDGTQLEINTFLPASSKPIKQVFEDNNATITLINREQLSFPQFFLRLTRHYQGTRPQIVHTMLDSSTGTWGRAAAVLTGVPNIFHSDRSLANNGTQVHFLLRSFLDRRTTRFLPNAEAIAERLRASHVPPEKITIMSNALDLDRFSRSSVKSLRPELKLPADAVIAGYLGRFSKEKRLDLLLDSIMKIPLQHRPDRLLLAGDGPDMPNVARRVATEPWLAEHVVLLGSIENTPEFLATLDYLVLCSDTEGLPNAVLEAMAMTVPIVSTDVSDVPQLIEGAGFLARTGDANSLAAALLKMQQLSKGQRNRLGETGRCKVNKRHGHKAVAEAFWQAHLEVLK